MNHKKQNGMNKNLYIVRGLPGSGKSTLAHLLSTYYNVPLVNEPVEHSPFLPLFYADKKRFALVSQNAFYGELFLSMWETKDEPFLICDSTMFSNLVFTELLKKEKVMNDEEVDLTYKIADAHMKLLPDLDNWFFILVKTLVQ